MGERRRARPTPSTLHPGAAVCMMLLGLASCGSDRPQPVGEGAVQQEGAGGTVQREAPTGGPDVSLRLGDLTYAAFHDVYCDLGDEEGGGLLLSAIGTAPDGRRITLDVEQFGSETLLQQEVRLYFGNIMDGDQWTATAARVGAEWFVDPSLGEPLEDALVTISDDGVAAGGAFRHETEGETLVGELVATCA